MAPAKTDTKFELIKIETWQSSKAGTSFAQPEILVRKIHPSFRQESYTSPETDVFQLNQPK
jgi:hypothetical protein